MDMPSAFNLTVRLDNVAVITIDVHDEKMNTLKAEFGVQVRAMLKQIRENKAIRGLVFISAKPDNFMAKSISFLRPPVSTGACMCRGCETSRR